MFAWIGRRWRRHQFLRKVRLGGFGGPEISETLQVMADWMHDVADGYHRVGQHDVENDIIAIGRRWAEESVDAYRLGDVEQLRAVCVGAADAILTILRRDIDEALEDPS